MKRCRHCGKYKAAFQRKGLCYRCSTTPEIRRQYATASPFGRRGTSEPMEMDRPAPKHPTAAPPGSSDKLRVMVQRAEAGCSLFHPEDVELRAYGVRRIVRAREFIEPQDVKAAS